MTQKRVLVVLYSQTGQLEKALKYCISPLIKDKNIKLEYLYLRPKIPYKFPWKTMDFLDVFPESVYCDKIELEEFGIDKEAEFDLVILAYQVWFLSPSLPMSSFLQSEAAKKWLSNKPVVTFIACRNMWLEAQEKMKNFISLNGGILCDNIALIDGGNAIETFITTPRWLLSGKKEAFWCFSAAGIKESDMIESARFGKALKKALLNDEEKKLQPMLKGLGAVNVNDKLIAGERIGHRSFLIWGKLIKKLSRPQTPVRRALLCVYLVFLVCMIVTILPITLLLRRLFYPLMKRTLSAQKAYYEEPSGSFKGEK